MDKSYICYCGLYCENCAVKAKINPAAKVLYEEMKSAEFEDIIHMIPKGNEFWAFLKEMAEHGTCTSCKEGSGNPGCVVRICAKEKGVEMCALCEAYPCEKFKDFFEGYPMLKEDNALVLEKGIEAWGEMQDKRRSEGYVYQQAKK